MNFSKKALKFTAKWLIAVPIKWLFQTFANILVLFFGSTLPATAREKRMIGAFLLLIAIIGSYYLPAKTITAHFDRVKQLEIKVAHAAKPEIIKSVIKNYKVKSEIIREVTAYNVGDVNQCWGNPCISANGENICNALDEGHKRCAANFVPLGTRLHIDNYGECLVTDRMNNRFTNRVDIAMRLDELERAKKFGLQLLNVKILK